MEDSEDFADVSIAGRGFTALEYLLYDPGFADTGEYGCASVQAIGSDISVTSGQKSEDPQGEFAASFVKDTLALESLYGSVVTGLQFTAEARLGRPLGSVSNVRDQTALRPAAPGVHVTMLPCRSQQRRNWPGYWRRTIL